MSPTPKQRLSDTFDLHQGKGLTLTIMGLREIVDRYLAAAGGYSKVIPISALKLPRAEAEKVFNALDEDYNISRYIHFVCAAGADYSINGFPQSHISIDSDIQSIL
ncbi:MAG TPA: hypothetical protein VN727_07230 [Candidatus Binatia bacterium]|jgi:hypothetical protein|nr:hypothetical protein [Candidatus Binatia bacterium]